MKVGADFLSPSLFADPHQVLIDPKNRKVNIVDYSFQTILTKISSFMTCMVCGRHQRSSTKDPSRSVGIAQTTPLTVLILNLDPSLIPSSTLRLLQAHLPVTDLPPDLRSGILLSSLMPYLLTCGANLMLSIRIHADPCLIVPTLSLTSLAFPLHS